MEIHDSPFSHLHDNHSEAPATSEASSIQTDPQGNTSKEWPWSCDSCQQRETSGEKTTIESYPLRLANSLCLH